MHVAGSHNGSRYIAIIMTSISMIIVTIIIVFFSSMTSSVVFDSCRPRAPE